MKVEIGEQEQEGKRVESKGEKAEGCGNKTPLQINILEKSGDNEV